MRAAKISFLSLSALLLFGCSGDKTSDGGVTPVADSGVTDPPDAGFADALPVDTGPLPCLRDQGGEANRGCDPGFVCNVQTGMCVAGTACTNDTECNACSQIQNPADCGHGFALTAWCDPNHGNVCTRSRSPCEPCATDSDCGRQDSILGGTPNRCLDYGEGQKFCGRPCTLSCPRGFICDGDSNQCKRQEGCEADSVICPEGMPGQACSGTEQICADEPCTNAPGARCATNDLPGALGLCFGFCTANSDCPVDKPVCNTRNGICIAGCTKGSCPSGQVCHMDGFCAPPCPDNGYCEGDERYGASSYCNRPSQPPPRIFKGHRDENSCAPLGCEIAEDCPEPAVVCDRTLAIPACVPGCYESDDCLSGFVCKEGPQGNYNREQCRALPEKTDDSLIGVCCNPGCTDRVNQCGIGEFCCGEEDSPYEDPASCLTLTSTDTVRARPGECFEHPAPAPFCTQCTGQKEGECNSGWLPGYNTDPNINGGQPFQEEEFCTSLGQMGPNICVVTCNPNGPDTGCPSRWQCSPRFYTCFQDADCNGLECVGEDTTTMPPRAGRCKCGENGTVLTQCPGMLSDMTPVAAPRCLPFGTDMVCVASYYCNPNGPPEEYPAACGF